MVLEDLHLLCVKCGQTLQAKAYLKQVANGCVRESTATTQDILEMPLLHFGAEATEYTWSLNTSSNESVLRVKTGGQENTYKNNRLL